jgi:tetratricopeptide (TPR) repeat protein
VRRALAVARMGALLALGLAACGEDAAPPAPAAAASAHGIPALPLAGVDPDVVAAIESARAEVERDATSGDAWGRLGNRLFVHDFLPQAAECFARAEVLDPERYVWTYRRGLCLLDADPAEAVVHLERALASLDDHAPAHETYALALVALGRPDEAMPHFERASALDPTAPQADTGIGQVLLARGELEAARVHLEEALRRDPRHAEAHVALAQVYLGLGREADAQRHAELSRGLPETSRREDVFGSPTLPPAGARARTK